jgi:hypothetical protein
MDIKYPKGYPENYKRLKIAVSFPEELFHDVVKMAKKERRTFNSMIVELVKVGKLDLEESDALEPAAQPARQAATARR